MVQTVTCTSTVGSGTWTISGAATAHECLDEGIASADDTTTRIFTGLIGDVAEVHLGDPTDPVVHTGHKLIYRILSSLGGQKTVTTALYEGATLIASESQGAFDGVWVTHTLTLSEAEAANITDYTDLRARFTAAGIAGFLSVTAVDLEVPDPVVALTPLPECGGGYHFWRVPVATGAETTYPRNLASGASSTDTASESPLGRAGVRAKINGIFLGLPTATGATYIFQNHDGTDEYFRVGVSANKDKSIGDCEITVPDGLRVTTTGSTNSADLLVVYEVIG